MKDGKASKNVALFYTFGKKDQEHPLTSTQHSDGALKHGNKHGSLEAQQHNVLTSAAIDNIVIITGTNFGYLDLFENFMASIRKNTPQYARMVIAVAEDQLAYQYLRLHYPNNTYPQEAFGNQSSPMQESQNFGTLLFKKIIAQRPKHLLGLFSNCAIIFEGHP